MNSLQEYLDGVDAKMDQKCVPLLMLVAKELDARMNKTTAKYGLTYLQNTILHFLDDSETGTMTINELDSCLQQASNTSRSVTQLVNKGFVTKERDQEDDRVVNVTITDEGRKLHHSAEGDMLPLYSLGLNEEDATDLYEILIKIMTHQAMQEV